MRSSSAAWSEEELRANVGQVCYIYHVAFV